ncbi:MAG: site-specific integrase [Planctomycetes bacterium]|nr:site-specific integrase [Planctomycetota bacterium]
MANEADSAEGADGSDRVGEHVRIFQRGNVWYANFQHGGKQHRPSLNTTSKKEARRKALQIEVKLAAGQWNPAPEAATVPQAVAAYLDFLRAEERSPKTLSKYTKVFERVAELGTERKVKNLLGIDLAFIDAYRRKRTDDGVAPKTKYTETVIVRQLVLFALSRNMLATDPLRGLKMKKPKPTTQPCWTPEQLTAILANAPVTVKSAFTLLAETGMRFGELAWLTWEDVDVEANVLRIRPKEGWKPKSGDCRAIPISPVVQEILDALPRRWRWVVTMPPSATHPTSGRQWTERRLLSALKQVLRGLDFPGKLHTFRHAFISNALLKGTAVAVVREWVGHVDQQVIDLYTHVHNNASQTAMQRLAEANQQLQKEDKSRDSKEASSAQTQHTRKEDRNENDAK